MIIGTFLFHDNLPRTAWIYLILLTKLNNRFICNMIILHRLLCLVRSLIITKNDIFVLLVNFKSTLPFLHDF